MLIGRDKFDSVYAMVKEAAAECAGTACSVLIFVAPDCDAVCACRILTFLLRGDNVQYKVHPVSGYGDVDEASAGLAEDVRTIVMLNCGARNDLAALLAPRIPGANVFVVDHHRPIHLKNMHARRVFALDADASMDDVPSDDDDDDASSDSDKDADEENEDDRSVGDGQRDDQDTESTSSKRARGGEDDAARETRRQKRRRVRAYYDGNYDGMPSSLLLFSMCDALSRATPNELWLASIGLSSLHEHWRISDDNYDAFVRYLSRHLKQLDTSRHERLFRDRANQKTDGGAPSLTSAAGPAETGRVSFEPDEPRFMLHRHWGLLWSMYYSNFVASRLSVWRKDGTSKLYELLAKIGLSIEQSQQRWSFLSPAQRRKLRENLPAYAAEYRLDELFRAAFQRVSGCGGEAVTAADAASCVDALLEAPLARAIADETTVHGDDAARREKAAWLAGFWRAYDVALADDGDLLAAAIEAAIALQKAVVSVAVSMIDKKEITTLKHFRYVYLNAARGSTSLFTQPLALRKLGLFLLGVHRQNGKWTGDKSRPLVILAERSSTFLVIGVQAEGARKNRFGQSFRHAAEHIKACFRHDWFDAAVMEVDRDDVQRFVESLHYILSC
ncbi:hypothetical protein CTAYLR_005754 [Chrysophaeum taylorii]|uniref:Cell division control protein 45 n=1 Tax=Chrysophaeum taylorii TaxID=2483200 RepID=A0AAD7UIQ6_9STRA|nr:hypothetical protein CTAYLR_005754 [Chrysophaeum taylorii]